MFMMLSQSTGPVGWVCGGHGVSGGDVAGPITILASLGACACLRFVMGLHTSEFRVSMKILSDWMIVTTVGCGC